MDDNNRPYREVRYTHTFRDPDAGPPSVHYVDRCFHQGQRSIWLYTPGKCESPPNLNRPRSLPPSHLYNSLITLIVSGWTAPRGSVLNGKQVGKLKRLGELLVMLSVNQPYGRVADGANFVYTGLGLVSGIPYENVLTGQKGGSIQDTYEKPRGGGALYHTLYT